jgi:ABC-2 type transport system permease protein
LRKITANQIFALTWKDLKLFFKDARAMVLIFLQPFLFIVIMSYALAGVYGSGKPIKILAVNEDRGKEAEHVVKDLSGLSGIAVETSWEGVTLTRQEAEELITGGKRGLAVIFPADFSSVLERRPDEKTQAATKVLLMADPAAPASVTGPVLGAVQGMVERATFTARMPGGIDYLFDRYDMTATGISREALKEKAEGAVTRTSPEGGEKAVTVEKVAPKSMKIKQFPDSFQQNVPGYTVYGVFWIASLLAASVLREKREGTFARLMAAPISRSAVLAGKLIPYYLINILQIAIMMAASALLFKITFGRSAAGLAATSCALAACATALGILISALARTEAQASSMTVLLLIAMSALGGCFVPRFLMPRALQTIGLLTPHAWALDAYQDLIVRGYELIDVLPKVGVLVGFALIFFAVGIRRFRFE